jgi:hypothetical protein
VVSAAADKATSDVLVAAILAEREALERLRQARARLASLVIDAAFAGASYDELARLSIGTTKGRSASLNERRREADRLRQISHRQRVLCRKWIGVNRCDIEQLPAVENS